MSNGIRHIDLMTDERIRTEQTYIQWVRRFLYFCRTKSAEDLTAGDVKTYLEYLAVKKQVAASTQNQALSKAVSIQPSAIR